MHVRSASTRDRANGEDRRWVVAGWARCQRRGSSSASMSAATRRERTVEKAPRTPVIDKPRQPGQQAAGEVAVLEGRPRTGGFEIGRVTVQRVQFPKRFGLRSAPMRYSGQWLPACRPRICCISTSPTHACTGEIDAAFGTRVFVFERIALVDGRAFDGGGGQDGAAARKAEFYPARASAVCAGLARMPSNLPRWRSCMIARRPSSSSGVQPRPGRSSRRTASSRRK